jgi:PPOX class probable F420-dependent enzyme
VDERQSLERLGEARVARMATVDGQGAPHVVPVVFALEGRTIYWAVDHKPKRSPALKRLANLRANPAVQLVVDHYDQDWSSLWWVRATGQARILEGGDERERALELLAGKYPQYREQPPDGAVVAIDIERLAWWEG